MLRKSDIVKMETDIPWVVFEDPESGYWVGVCDSLKLTTQGETYQELVELIGETLDALFEDLLKEDELEAFLEEHNWKPKRPLPKRRSNIRFDLPFSINRLRKHDLSGFAA